MLFSIPIFLNLNFQSQYFWIWSTFQRVYPYQTSSNQLYHIWPTFQRVIYCTLPYQSWSNQHLSTFQSVSVFLHQCVSTNVFQPMCFNQCVSTPIYMSRCQHQHVLLITCICSAGASIQTTFNASVPRKHSNHIQCKHCKHSIANIQCKHPTQTFKPHSMQSNFAIQQCNPISM